MIPHRFVVFGVSARVSASAVVRRGQRRRSVVVRRRSFHRRHGRQLY
jgi:hypothetical protein